MALHSVHEDVEAGLGRQVDQVRQLVDGRRTDERAIGLEQRPEMEDADVVQAEPGYLGQVFAGLCRIEVVPGVEPAAAGRVVDAEAGCGGSADEGLLGVPTEGRSDSVPTRGRGLSSANVSTTMVSDEQ
ncbi:hypothetical protein [Streptomyces sp. 2A115]|uniref:hypothetical protein n=1 Tax=Streptomyces sp. 2A115 TaxID=3457439 RepID=UPI003FD0B659